EQQYEEDRRPEAEQEILPPGRAGIERLRVDDDAVLLQQRRQGVGVCERRYLRLEARRRLRLPVAQLERERPLDRRALRGDLLDVSRVDLVDEEGAVGNADAGRRLCRARAEVEVDREQDECEDDP